MSLLTVDDVIDLIDREASRLMRADDRVGTLRRDFLIHLRDALRESGFPVDPSRLRELSLVPFVFQEANHDDVDWTNQDASLGDLAGVFSIDVAVQTAGRRRGELTRREYQEYVDAAFSAIRWRTSTEEPRIPGGGGIGGDRSP